MGCAVLLPSIRESGYWRASLPRWYEPFQARLPPRRENESSELRKFAKMRQAAVASGCQSRRLRPSGIRRPVLSAAHVGCETTLRQLSQDRLSAGYRSTVPPDCVRMQLNVRRTKTSPLVMAAG